MNVGSSKRRAPQPVRQTLRFQQREAARAAILDAAEELIAAKGLHGSPLVDIAKLAGVAVGTLYNYFADRDDLVRALFESRRHTIRPLILDAIAASRELPFEQRLRALVRGTLAAFDQHRRYLKVVLEAEHLKPTNSTTADDLQAAIADSIAAGVAEGKLAAGAPAELAAFAIFGTIKMLILRRVADGRSLAEGADGLVDLVLDGTRLRGAA